MDEDIKVTPMRPISETLDALQERIANMGFSNDEVCEVCNGTGTELIIEDGIARGRVCRHIG